MICALALSFSSLGDENSPEVPSFNRYKNFYFVFLTFKPPCSVQIIPCGPAGSERASKGLSGGVLSSVYRLMMSWNCVQRDSTHVITAACARCPASTPASSATTLTMPTARAPGLWTTVRSTPPKLVLLPPNTACTPTQAPPPSNSTNGHEKYETFSVWFHLAESTEPPGRGNQVRIQDVIMVK